MFTPEQLSEAKALVARYDDVTSTFQAAMDLEESEGIRADHRVYEDRDDECVELAGLMADLLHAVITRAEHKEAS